MLKDMDDMEASCVIHVKVCMFYHLEQSKVSVLTIAKIGIVMLT